ncbi:MAG TPA: DUF4396 domain-containing protein, partial [Pirellulales bacterium]|nr:DUF4396 domain-containing protein [Pirellulales bacterium]
MIWLNDLAWLSLAVGIAASIVILIDVVSHPQPMAIMNVVWPVTGLYAGPLGLWAYYSYGRAAITAHAQLAMQGGAHASPHDHHQHGAHKPLWQQVLVATTHCGSGCTLGDIAAEAMLIAFPFAVFGSQLYASWLLGFIWAYVLGIVFQYFTIAPMRQLSVGRGILAAIRADTLSLCAWQLGMYGWMAAAVFLIFHRQIDPTGPVFWFMMQIAMLCGFLTSYPVNWLL